MLKFLFRTGKLDADPDRTPGVVLNTEPSIPLGLRLSGQPYTLLDLWGSSWRKGHANLLRIVQI